MITPTAAQIGHLVRAHLALLAIIDQIADRAMAAPTHRPSA